METIDSRQFDLSDIVTILNSITNSDKRKCIDGLSKINAEIGRVQSMVGILEKETGDNTSKITQLRKDLDSLETLKTDWEDKLENAPINSY